GRGRINADQFHVPVAAGGFLFFYGFNFIGGRSVCGMPSIFFALKGVSLAALFGPGLFSVPPSNYTPLFTHCVKGFAASLLPIFFAYAGFESLAQTAGEVKDSTQRLPMILLKGISATALIYVLMSIVSFGVLPGERLQFSNAPMAEVASVYLPAG